MAAPPLMDMEVEAVSFGADTQTPMSMQRDKNIVKNTDSSTNTLGLCVCVHTSAVWYSNIRASLPAHLVDIG